MLLSLESGRTSSTELTIGLTVSNEVHSGTTPSRLKTPALGRIPTTPHNAGGHRPEPEVSEPSAATHIPAATAAAEPDDEPPAIRSGFHGFRVGPKALTTPLMPKANSCMLVLPTMTAPARFSLCTTSASFAGTRSRY